MPSDNTSTDTSEPTAVSRRAALRLAATGGLAGTAGCALLGEPGSTPTERPTATQQPKSGCPEPAGTERSPRPGPAFLYSDPVTPPQLENAGEWEADPLLVAGTDAYVDGEYLYQDYVYDDYGANTSGSPTMRPRGLPETEPNDNIVSPTGGNVVYPDDEDRYGYNAADLLEFRARHAEGGVAYRITLGTMLVPDAAAVAVGIDTGGDSGTAEWGYGIGALGDLNLDHVLVTWGTGAELVDADGGATEVDASVDADRNQIEVVAPLEPGEATWRHYAVVGLWDDEAEGFAAVADEPTATRPGGARGTDPPPVFNVAFRFEERGNWRDFNQAVALAERDVSGLHVDLDFGTLAAGETASSVPETGYVNRLYGSRFDLGEGILDRFPSPARFPPGDPGDVLQDRVQPYGLYVPESYDPAEEHPVHVDLHGYGSNHNAADVGYENLLGQLGEDRDALVVAPLARGPGLFYSGAGELDVLEALADVVARYNVDLDRLTIGGYSMGGFGTFKLASQFPDLFAKAFPVVGSATFGGPLDNLALLDNLRHVPVLMWNARDDQIVQPSTYRQTARRLRELGYRHQVDEFVGWGHGSAAETDEWGRAREFLESDFLGEPTVTRSPSRVTYRRVPALDQPDFGLVHDGAYWVDGIEVAADADSGLVDARSLAAGGPEPEPETYTDSGTAPSEHESTGVRWTEPAEDAPAENGLDVQLDGATAVTLYVDETDLDVTQIVDLSVEASHGATITLESAAGTADVTVPPGTSTETVDLCPSRS